MAQFLHRIVAALVGLLVRRGAAGVAPSGRAAGAAPGEASH
jgi:hypothetical protein